MAHYKPRPFHWFVGHTVPSRRQVVDHVVGVIDKMKDDVSDREAKILDESIEDIYSHANSVSFANTYHT